MNSAFVVRWVRPVPGREKAALDYAVEVNEHWGKLAADGRCSEPEMFFLPDGTGIWIVRGDREALAVDIATDTSERLIARGQLLLEGFRFDLAVTGGAAERYLLGYAAEAAALGVL